MKKDEVKKLLLETNYFEDNEGLDKYSQLIEDNENLKKEKYITNKHHILPKCYFKLNNLEVDNSKENIVNLLYKDHILAHYYLCLCCIYKPLLFRLSNAFFHLTNRKWKYKDFGPEANLDEFERIHERWCIEIGEVKKGNSYKLGLKLSEKVKNKISKSNKGKKRDTEVVNKIAAKNKGKKRTKETLIKMSLAHQNAVDPSKTKGKIWINNGVDNFRIESNLLDDYIAKGYSKGRLKFNEATINHMRQTSLKKSNFKVLVGTIKINNGVEEKNILPEELECYLNLGWVKGRLPLTQEVKNKMSTTRKGRIFTKEWKEKLSLARKGKIYINNGAETKMIFPQEYSNYPGWNKGFLK